jgi:hypothetical protein
MGCAVSSPRPRRRTRAGPSQVRRRDSTQVRRRDSAQVYETAYSHNYPSESIARHYYPDAQPDPGHHAIRRVGEASGDLRRPTSARSRTARLPKQVAIERPTKQVRIERAYSPPPAKRRVRRKPAQGALRSHMRTSSRDVRSNRTSTTRSSRRSTTRRSTRHPPSSSKTYGNSVSYIGTHSSGRTLVHDNGHSDYWDWALGSHRFPVGSGSDEYRVLTVPSDVTSSSASRVSGIGPELKHILTVSQSSSSFYMSTPRKRTRARVPNYYYTTRRY